MAEKSPNVTSETKLNMSKVDKENQLQILDQTSAFEISTKPKAQNFDETSASRS